MVKKINTFALCIMLSALCSGCGTREGIFFVENAALKKIEVHKKKIKQVKLHTDLNLGEKEEFFLQTGHIIAQGQGSVIAFRAFIKPLRSLFNTSNEFYRNISIYIPKKILDKGEIKINPNDDGEGFVFFSEGNLAYPQHAGCSGYAKEGIINWRREVSGKLSVDVEFKADMVSLLTGSNDKAACMPNPVVFKRHVIIKEKRIEEANYGVWPDMKYY